MKDSRTFYNWISVTGFVITVNSLILMLTLLVINILSAQNNDYLGVYIYVVLPFFLLLGLLMIPFGMFLRVRKKLKSGENTDLLPVANLNIKKHRDNILKITLVVILFIVASLVGTYQAFQYTNSVNLCGKVCHTVMEPEYITYLNSAHAKVPCVDCHIGEGANWFIKSRLAGLYLIYSNAFNKYPHPLITPIGKLRPERQTCEHCHWPQKFYARKLTNKVYYLADSANTEWNISMIMKTGPKNSALGLMEGIHWHINPDFKTEYISDSRDRESISWVRQTNLVTGEVKVFTDQTKQVSPSTKSDQKICQMDCMDCHNRPSHLFRYPTDYVDNELLKARISKNIPYIKRAAMEVLKIEYPDTIAAAQQIYQGINDFYQKKHPVIWAAQSRKIKDAIKVIIRDYTLNSFPGMKTDAYSHLNHIGHMESNGCFRCHSGNHKTSTGEVISNDCNLCHTIVEQGRSENTTYTSLKDSLPFVHPVALVEKSQPAHCSECHRRLFN